MGSLLKATAVAVVMGVLSATAEAADSSYTPDFLMSPIFLWVTANAIIIWLVSSSRRGRTDDTTTSPSAGHEPQDDGEVVPGAVDSQNYTSSSEHGAFSDAGRGRRAEAPLSKRLAQEATSSSEYDVFSDAGSGRRAKAPVSKRLAQEAKAASRRSDRPRVRKKPASLGAPSPRAFAAKAREPDDDIRSEGGTPVTVVADGVHDDEDVSMDSLWQSIVQRRAARPVVVQKSDSWGNDELPRLERVAETAAATRREMRKSVSAVTKAAAPPPQPTPPSVPSAIRQLGWRTRDVLATITPDELLRRAESLIRRHHEHLRLQRQESEQRQQQLRFHLRAPGPGPIRV